MRTPFTGRRRSSRVDFCEACGQVCDAACRANAQRDRARTWGLGYTLGIR